MATRRYQRTKAAHTKLPPNDAFEAASFMADLLDGTINATSITITRLNERAIRIDYEDPGQEGAAERAEAKP